MGVVGVVGSGDCSATGSLLRVIIFIGSGIIIGELTLEDGTGTLADGSVSLMMGLAPD